ncbi:Phosphoesterase domain protein [Kalmanozyma brasiliensis GHG001]|uniref:Acid sphingomyelinase and PHM5 phosphate metabolism protein n=1 Tax=Kalmanozyma brasiliensis (strain GHG001) TaxID=1365824 RepID=V5EBS9_KALBG|nr:Phosphoesterase domain protein [Kalmanozyma brasiliensis GHG001]EST07886.1 Phosphoesterase domain protein [Kalmanozyma brasiliensis GHG001]
MKSIASLAVLLGLAQLAASSPAFVARRNDASSAAEAFNKETSAYTASSAFPTSMFASYYNTPASMTAEPRPVVTDVGRNSVFPDILANPTILPLGPSSSEAVYPVATGTASPDIVSQVRQEITDIFASSSSNCTKCTDALKTAQKLAQQSPQDVPALLIELCTKYKFKSASTCAKQYAPQVLGSVYAQVLSYANFSSGSTDAQYMCNVVVGSSFSNCSLPKPRLLDEAYLDDWFHGKRTPPSSYNLNVGEPTANGGNLRVLHMSDIHVDPRFFVGGEAACTNGRCCRADAYNSTLSSGNFTQGTLSRALSGANISESATYWGNFQCDAPWSLALSTLGAVTPLNGGHEVDMTIHTGDMVVHDLAQYISQDLVKYTHQSLYDSIRAMLGKGPVFNAIGNHDSAPSDFASQGALPDGRSDQLSWDWDNLARLWEAEGWFDHDEAEQVRSHYAGYSVTPRKGLRIVAINTDFWYKNNIFNMIHTSNPDYSGSLRFLTDELFHAEQRGERVWIVGHVLTGWDGSNPLDNPTNLFYQIVDRFAPHVIAHIFFGHTHEDQFNIFYANNGTSRAADQAKAVSFMAPSVTPGNNVNPALRIMHVNATTYEVMDYHQFYTQVPTFPDLPESSHGPVYEYLYSARQAYGNFTSSNANSTHPVDGGVWPQDAPLNATFWAKLTEEMAVRKELVQQFTVFQGRNSPRSPNCTSDECVSAKICYMQSGSAPLGKQCKQGYGSVQSS